VKSAPAVSKTNLKILFIIRSIMNNINEKRADISVFLERLIDQYKSQQLTEEQEMRITEFYIKECYLKESNVSVSSNDSDDSFKYLTMGWYIYEHLIKKK
jgi:hypothetical protein